MAVVILHGFSLCLIFVLGAAICTDRRASAESAAKDGEFQNKAAPEVGGRPPDETGKTADADGWRLVRGSAASAEKGSAAILHTADFGQSDPRLAGLMLRCGNQGIEAVIVVVEPFPPHAQPQITLRTSEGASQFAGGVIPTGAGIRLPDGATKLVTGAWFKARELDVRVTDGEAVFGGVVGLSGLQKALEWLTVECVQK
jgi:hypothetical protein